MLELIYVDTVRYDAGKPRSSFMLIDMDKIKTKKVAVFGNGMEAYFANMYLKKQGIYVEKFINNDIEMTDKLFCGIKTVRLDRIEKEDYYIIVALTQQRYNNEVIWQLKLHGYKEWGLSFTEIYHAFCGDSFQIQLHKIVLEEINKILCGEKNIDEVIKPVVNVGPAGDLLGDIPELCWTTTWSNCLLEWFYLRYKIETGLVVLEIGPGKGVFSAVMHRINTNINIEWLIFDMDKSLEKPIDGIGAYPANLFSAYYGMIENPEYHINKKFDLIIMTEVMEHFVNNPIPTIKKIANMLKEDGRLYLSTPNWGHLSIYDDYKEIPDYTTRETYKENYVGHTFQYYENELKDILEQCGLVIEKYSLSDSRNHNLIARRRME